MLKRIALAVAIAITLFAIFVWTRPAEFTISRSIEISASPEGVFAILNDFHRWDEWSPWSRMDPNMKKDYSGSPLGEGARYAWRGNEKVGSGRMTITQSHPPMHLEIKLEFFAPFETTNRTEFHIDKTPQGSRVTWTMSGHNNFVSKLFGLVMDMDKMVGKDFEKGLSNLKHLAEQSSST